MVLAFAMGFQQALFSRPPFSLFVGIAYIATSQGVIAAMVDQPGYSYALMKDVRYPSALEALHL